MSGLDESMVPSAPSRADVVAMLRSLIGGSTSREEAANWAAKWVVARTPPDMQDDVWEALKFLSAADMISLDRPYLYNHDDFEHALQTIAERIT